MGYGYGRDPRTNRMKLACDECGGLEGARKRPCPQKVDGLRYCPAPALCASCWVKLGKGPGVHGARCAEGAAARRVQIDARKVRLDAGEFMLGAAWGDWQRTVPTGFVGIVLRDASRAEKWRLAVEEDFERVKRESATGDVFERDFEALAPWADPDSAPAPRPGAGLEAVVPLTSVEADTLIAGDEDAWRAFYAEGQAFARGETA